MILKLNGKKYWFPTIEPYYDEKVRDFKKISDRDWDRWTGGKVERRCGEYHEGWSIWGLGMDLQSEDIGNRGYVIVKKRMTS